MLTRAAAATVDLGRLAVDVRHWADQVPDRRALALQAVLAGRRGDRGLLEPTDGDGREDGWRRARLAVLVGRLGPVEVPDAHALASLPGMYHRAAGWPAPPAEVVGTGRPGRGTAPPRPRPAPPRRRAPVPTPAPDQAAPPAPDQEAPMPRTTLPPGAELPVHDDDSRLLGYVVHGEASPLGAYDALDPTRRRVGVAHTPTEAAAVLRRRATNARGGTP